MVGADSHLRPLVPLEVVQDAVMGRLNGKSPSPSLSSFKFPLPLLIAVLFSHEADFATGSLCRV